MHFGKLGAHGAAVNCEEVRQLLPVEWNLKAVASGQMRLLGQVGHQLFTCGAAGHVHQLPVQLQRLCGNAKQEVFNHFGVTLAGFCAGSRDFVNGDQHDRAALDGNYADIQRQGRGRIDLGKQTPCGFDGENIPPSPDVLADYMRAAFQ